jgi:cellulose synthase/poly-beta-1,6-N-acetylglucosamine synthase-like glycosyltransferase
MPLDPIIERVAAYPSLVLAILLAWLPIGLLVWVYLGYPVLAWILGAVRPIRLRQDRPEPTLTVAIAVHDEADVIALRIADAFAQEASGARIAEVLVGSDGSTDGTDEIVRSLAVTDPRLRLVGLSRSGQTPTQHELFEAATGDVVILTDAETRFGPGCLRALAEAMRDDRVGCATGRLEWRNEEATATSANEGLYWRYERWVRDMESRAGLLTAVTGALLAVRRSAYRPVPAFASMDHLLPLYVRESGGLVVYVPGAVATDRPISGLREQYRNRTRTATRGIRSNLSMTGRLAPWRNGRAAIAIWSHKLLRWATPWLVGWAGTGGALLAMSGKAAYLLVPGFTTIGLVAALVGQLLAGTGVRPPRPLAFARGFAVANLAFARAWVDVARGRRIEAWHRGGIAADG